MSDLHIFLATTKWTTWVKAAGQEKHLAANHVHDLRLMANLLEFVIQGLLCFVHLIPSTFCAVGITRFIMFEGGIVFKVTRMLHNTLW